MASEAARAVKEKMATALDAAAVAKPSVYRRFRP